MAMTRFRNLFRGAGSGRREPEAPNTAQPRLIAEPITAAESEPQAAAPETPASVRDILPPIPDASPDLTEAASSEVSEPEPAAGRSLAESLGKAVQLRDSGRFEEAETLLTEAVERFPAEPRPRVEWALLPHVRRDWAEAVRRWQLVRDNFPNEVVAHALGAVGLRELGRHDEAQNLLAAARESFPDDLGIANENAWLATYRRDWAEALRRWGRIRKQFPDHPAGYTGMAMIQRELRWFDEADAMLTDAVERFPTQPGPHIDYARLSETRGNWAEAAAGWEAVRERFPNHPAGYVSGAGALRELGRLDEAEALLAEAVERFPNDAGLAIGYAAAAHRRRDWEETVRRCETLRAAFPLEPIGYTLAGAALREMGRYDEAEPLLASACARFRADIGVATEHALIALAKRDWARAAERWDEVCRRDPNQLGASLHQAVALRELGRYDDAEALLRQAATKFPEAAQPLIEFARAAEARQDWEEALIRWREARTRFPDESGSYVGEAAALRRIGRIEEAEPLLLRAAERLPHDPAPLADWALIAHERRDWEEALKRWDSVHANFPDHRNAYVFGAAALRELGRLGEAEALLRSAIGRFSPDFGLQVEHGRIAEARGDMAEAQERWAALKSAFPQYSLGYISEARALRQLGRFDEAEQLLATAVSLFPDDPGARSEYAWLAQVTRDFEQAADRWQEMRTRLPDLPVGYSVGAAALRELNRFDEAEALLADASDRFPHDGSVILERARFAHMRRDWPAAAARWEVVRRELPNEAEGYASGGIALAEQERFDEADEVLKEGLRRFPSNQRLYAVFADLASMRNDWPEAFSRWTEAQNRFPDARDFSARLFEARLRLYEVDPEGIAALGDSPAEQGGDAADMRDIMMAFESLGHGCEFGSVQREFGSEPLGLLRWGAISPQDLSAALDTGFAGVGAPENTELTLRPNGERSEYWVADRRFGMEMHTFIGAEQISFERMFEQSCRRMEFLSRKLLDDLEKAEKIFVYKLDHRDLTDEEIFGLHAALRRYGDATLLCVRRENGQERNGTVHILGPGLMVAYIDRFAEPQADGRLTVALNSWSEICRAAYQLWKSGAVGPAAEASAEAATRLVDATA